MGTEKYGTLGATRWFYTLDSGRCREIRGTRSTKRKYLWWIYHGSSCIRSRSKWWKVGIRYIIPSPPPEYTENHISRATFFPREYLCFKYLLDDARKYPRGHTPLRYHRTRRARHTGNRRWTKYYDRGLRAMEKINYTFAIVTFFSFWTREIKVSTIRDCSANLSVIWTRFLTRRVIHLLSVKTWIWGLRSSSVKL